MATPLALMEQQDCDFDEVETSSNRLRSDISALHGLWGENMALLFLARDGWIPVDRNVRPCARDRRCEIDLIVRSRDRSLIVFVEVKTHARRSPWAQTLWGVDRRKRGNLLRACTNWIMKNKWHGNFRFDVVEVYGAPGAPEPPEIQHIENVRLFPAKWRFW